MNAITICNHEVMKPSKSLGKLMTMCAGCERWKKWPWVKMVKCCQCKKLWHLNCLPPRTPSSPVVEKDARSGPHQRTKRDFVKMVFIVPEKKIWNKLHRKNRSSLCADVAKSVRVKDAKRDRDSNENTILLEKEKKYKRSENVLVTSKKNQSESHNSFIGSLCADVAKSVRVEHAKRDRDSNENAILLEKEKKYKRSENVLVPAKKNQSESHSSFLGSLCADVAKSVRVEYVRRDKDSNENAISLEKEKKYKRSENFLVAARKNQSELYSSSLGSLRVDVAKSVRVDHAKRDRDFNENTILLEKEKKYRRSENFLVPRKETQSELHSCVLGSLRADVAKSLHVAHVLSGGDSNISNQHTLLPTSGLDQVLSQQNFPQFGQTQERKDKSSKNFLVPEKKIQSESRSSALSSIRADVAKSLRVDYGLHGDDSNISNEHTLLPTLGPEQLLSRRSSPRLSQTQERKDKSSKNFLVPVKKIQSESRSSLRANVSKSLHEDYEKRDRESNGNTILLEKEKKDQISENFLVPHKKIQSGSHCCSISSHRADVAKSLCIDHGLRDGKSNENTLLPTSDPDRLSQRYSSCLSQTQGIKDNKIDNSVVSGKKISSESCRDARGSLRADVAQSVRVDHGKRHSDSDESTILPRKEKKDKRSGNYLKPGKEIQSELHCSSLSFICAQIEKSLRVDDGLRDDKSNENTLVPTSKPDQLLSQWDSLHFSQTKSQYFTSRPVSRAHNYKGKNNNGQNGTNNNSCKGAQTLIEDFRLLRLLGRGAFGEVILVQHKKSKGYFAIKVLDKQDIISENIVNYLLSEKKTFELVSRNRHPFLVNAFGCFQTKSNVCFIMDYAAAGDLSMHLQRDVVFTEPRAIFYAACVVLGLEYLHENNICHRDLKLNNILMSADGYVKLADFGYCKEGMGYEDRTITFCGTLKYMAPEIHKRISYTRSVDWWSLGVVIFQMLVGKIPFVGTENELYEAIMDNEVCYPDSLSLEAMAITMKLLQKDPVLRLGSCKRGAEDVKKQLFFHKIVWKDLSRKEVKPPFIPEITPVEDVSIFDNEKLSNRHLMYEYTGSLSSDVQELFKDFA